MSVTGFCAELNADAETGNMQIFTEVPSEHKITVSYNDGGFVLIGGKLCPNGTEIPVDRFGEIDLDVICKKGYHIGKILMNGEDVTDKFADGTLTVENVVNDVCVEFFFEECAKTPDDKCVTFDAEGNVYLGKEKLGNADLYIDFGSYTAKTDKDGRYYIDDISEGRHIVSISKDGKKLGTCEFVISVCDDIDEVVIIKMPNGTQNVLVPRGEEKIYLDFTIADENGDGIPDVDPDETDPAIPPEDGFKPDPDAPPRDGGVEISVGEPKKEVDPIIPPTLAALMQHPVLMVSVMLTSLFFVFFLIWKRKKDDDEEEQQTV